jgi:hypothetical protein
MPPKNSAGIYIAEVLPEGKRSFSTVSEAENMTKRELKERERRIERAYYARCSGVQINVMDIFKVFRCGADAIAAGASDAELGDKIAAFVASIAR